MDKLLNKVDKLLNVHVPSRPSFFQLQFFLIGKEPTHQAKLKRILDELRAMRRDVDAATDEIGECLDRRRLLELGQAKDLPEGPQEVMEIRSRMLVRRIGAIDKQIFNLRQVVSNKVEEMAFLCDMYDKLVANQEQLPWDNYEVQLEYWEAKLKNELALRMQLKAPVDMETIKTALSLPDSSLLKKELLSALPQALLERRNAHK